MRGASALALDTKTDSLLAACAGDNKILRWDLNTGLSSKLHTISSPSALMHTGNGLLVIHDHAHELSHLSPAGTTHSAGVRSRTSDGRDW